MVKHNKLILSLLFLLYSSPVWSAPSNTMSVTPTATSGATITASDENSRNSSISTTYNAHSHTDISSMSSVNSFSVGDGLSGTKQYLVDDAQGSSPGFRFSTTWNYWQTSVDGSTWDAMGLSSGVVIQGENTFRVGDNTNTGNKSYVANIAGTSDPSLRYTVSPGRWDLSTDNSTFTAIQTVSGSITVTGVNDFNLGDGTANEWKRLVANKGSGSTNPFIAYRRSGAQWVFSNDGSTVTALPTSTGANVKTGEFTRDTTLASGTQVITGVGFTPKAVIFFAGQSNAAGEASWGMDDGTTPKMIFDRNTVTTDTYGYSGDLGTFSIGDIETSTINYAGVISAFSSDGFTITWTRTSTPSGTLSVEYIAIG